MSQKRAVRSIHASKLQELGFRYLPPTRSEELRQQLEDACSLKGSQGPKVRREAVACKSLLCVRVFDEYGVMWSGDLRSWPEISKLGLKKVSDKKFGDLFYELGGARISTS